MHSQPDAKDEAVLSAVPWTDADWLRAVRPFEVAIRVRPGTCLRDHALGKNAAGDRAGGTEGRWSTGF
jgi:hypothetical protein